MRRKAALGVLLLTVAAWCSGAEAFRFAYTKGEKYRILSQVRESVWVNGRFSHDAEILNKIAVEVTDVREDEGNHSVIIQTSERSVGSRGTYQWSEEYESDFWRDGRGAYDIDPSYFMPVVRDVPLFPEGDVQIGDTWVAPGSEVQDFRQSFGIEKPFRFPITVHYSYDGNEKRNGIDCAVISIGYTVFHRVTATPRTTKTYPTRITGYSNQTYWWDIASRRPLYYNEEFDFIYTLATGDEVEYAGEAEGELVESTPLDKARMAEQIGEEIRSQGIEGASVAPTEEGVTITIENVQFPPNSDELLAPEQKKLSSIAEILKKFPDRDIAVTGHAARAPGYTEQQYQTLSEMRARAVADYLLSLGARSPEQMISRGMGATVPVADNSTEEGMKKNRRVEITILEN